MGLRQQGLIEVPPSDGFKVRSVGLAYVLRLGVRMCRRSSNELGTKQTFDAFDTQEAHQGQADPCGSRTLQEQLLQEHEALNRSKTVQSWYP